MASRSQQEWEEKLLGKYIVDPTDKYLPRVASDVRATEIVHTDALPNPNRVIPPNCSVTADFVGER
ncbi:hypothetical protein H072_9719 [Dactylellina haptotyla CBS 200.50]|uniref:Uncharacterized protein n=1 Tax=Dactylellina haptotyla (strain CBS 200.50) TaxID=1284197 RepID=S8A1W0_DACHA|nr:hypothetical protein H072_9719 [Dactylellina haptotyla CBS 200.50]